MDLVLQWFGFAGLIGGAFLVCIAPELARRYHRSEAFWTVVGILTLATGGLLWCIALAFGH